MRLFEHPTRESLEDIFFGQLVVIVARWFLIGTGTVLVLWDAPGPTELVAAVVPLVLLMATNFYLHGRYVLERPANPALLLAASTLDLALVTLVIILGPAGRGFHSPLFVLYYPAVLAVAFVVPRILAVAYTALAVSAYGGACLWVDFAVVTNGGDLEVLIQRLTLLVAMGGLGTFYWRIQRARRRRALEGRGIVQGLGDVAGR